jgi:ankyrin repeat protein
MTTKSQDRFLKWAKTKKGHWPEAKRGKYRIPVLNLAIQEGVAGYLKTKDISPLRNFLETSAKFLIPNDTEKLKPLTIFDGSFSPDELPRAKIADALCEVYGFIGDYESAWQVCVQSGLDSDLYNYLTFAVRSNRRKFTARQAYYFPAFRPPLTRAGRTHKDEIFPLVEEELGKFEAKEGKNLFDFYLDTSTAKTEREFLHRYFSEVCRAPKKFGIRPNIWTLKKIFKDNNHQIKVCQMSQLNMQRMAEHLAKIFRDCEDRFRQSIGLRGVGQGWVSESTLFALLKKSFPNQVVLQHARPEWIGRQHLDVYFPRLNLAVEYQGAQHDRAVPIFGGEVGLSVRKQLDKKKKELCRVNGCRLIEIFPGEPMQQVVEEIKSHIGEKGIFFDVTPANEIEIIVHSRPTFDDRQSVLADTKKATPKRRSSESWKKNLGKDSLIACARHGDGELIRRLESERVKLKTFRNGEKETLLFIACKAGNLETATALLEAGLDPNARDWRKASVLSKICNRWSVRPKPEIVRLLLKYGADPNLHGTLTPAVFGHCGYALPMNGCAIEGFLDCAKVLFESIGNVNQQQPKTLLTPLMCACHRFDRHQFEHRSVDMIRWLIEMGADLEMRSKGGCNSMDFALGANGYIPADWQNVEADHIAPVEVLKILHAAGARPAERFKPIFEIAIKRKLQ